MDLEEYIFPVVEKPIALRDWPARITAKVRLDSPGQYKVIVREDTNEIISVVRGSYKLVPNEELIKPMLTELDGLGMASYIDETHSFVNNHRMRLQITFPEITIQDRYSEIALSLFLHNSYNASEAVRIFFGAIRLICSNGMVFGRVLAQYYARHTKGFNAGYLKEILRIACEQLPLVQNRITSLDSEPVTEELRNRIEREIGKRIAKRVFDTQPESQWQAYNEAARIISHDLDQSRQARYQQALSKAFGL